MCPCGCIDRFCDHSGFYVCEQCPEGCHIPATEIAESRPSGESSEHDSYPRSTVPGPFDPLAHTLCKCVPCVNAHNDSYFTTMCFGAAMVRVDNNGHGKCIDPWNQGCTCTGTAVDGECEGCWLWLK